MPLGMNRNNRSTALLAQSIQSEFNMKVIFSLIFSIILHDATVFGKPVSSGSPNNQTCPTKPMINSLCSNIKQDMGALMGALFRASKNTTQRHAQLLPKTKTMFSNFSTLKKLKKEKIVKRLFIFHNILRDAYGFFGNTTNPMKTKTMNIVIQIKALAEILQNNASCNPGIPGNEFKFGLPKDKPSSGQNRGSFYHLAALLKDMQSEFEKNVVQQLKSI